MINIQVVKVNTKKEFDLARRDIIGDSENFHKYDDKFWKSNFLGFVNKKAPKFIFLSQTRIKRRLKKIFLDESIVDKDVISAYSIVATIFITQHELGHTAGILRETNKEYSCIDSYTGYCVEEYIANEIGYDHIEKMFSKKLLIEFMSEMDQAWCPFINRDDNDYHWYFKNHVKKLPKGIQRDIKFEINERKKLIKEFNLVY